MDKFKSAMEGLRNMAWEIHPKFGYSFLSTEESERQKANLSILRGHRLDEGIYNFLKHLIDMGVKNRIELEAIMMNIPRRQAQEFISKKNVRDWLFRRDGYKCLCCGVKQSLSIDHIVSVKNGGPNRLGNLQTLCSRCNSMKSRTYKDFR